MDCNQALEAISAALDGELSQAELTQLDRHLAGCPDCRALAEDFGILSVALSDMEEAPPPALSAQLQTILQSDSSPRPDRATVFRRRQRRIWGSLAAMLALVVCLGSLYVYLGTPLAAGNGSSASESAGNEANTTDSQDQQAMAPASCDSSSAPEEKTLVPDTEPDQTTPPASSASVSPSETDDTPQAYSSQPLDGSVSSKSSVPDAGASDDSPSPQEFFAVPAPSEPSVNTVQDSPEDEDTGSAFSSPDGSGNIRGPLSPAQALTLVFDYLGGSAVYPDAVLPDSAQEPSCQLLIRTENAQTVVSILEYEGLSPNETYYTFRMDEVYYTADSQTPSRTETYNHFAVSLDGTKILAQTDPEDGVSDAEAYESAINQ